MEYRLKEVFEFIRNGASIKQFDTSLGYPITRIETIANSYINIDKMGYAAIEELDKFEDYLLKDGDILMSHINSEKHLGKSAIYENINEDIIHGMNLLCLRPNKEVSYPKFLNYFFNSNKFRRQLPKITKKSVNQASFSVSDLKEVKIYLPNIDIQKNISKVLDKSQVLIYKRKTQIEYLDEIVKSRFIEMFGDPARNPKGWEMTTISEITTDVRYGTSKPAVEGGKYPYLRMNNITYSGYLNLENLKYIDIEGEELEKCIVRKGDVLFNRTNSAELIGKTCVFNIEEPMIIAGYIIRIRLNKEVLPIYLSMFLNSNYGKGLLRGMAKGAVNQANINAQELKSINIAIPPIELQNQFSTFVSQVDKLKFEAQKSLTEMENNFNSLMQRAFSGELFN